MLAPYIGITTFTEVGQVKKALAVFKKNFRPKSKRVLHVGAMMSYKTLHGLPSRWEDVFPKKEMIASLFMRDACLYNCLHYADYENASPELWRTLDRAISYGGIYIDAIQLDMVWPEPAEIANGVHVSRKPLEVILQVGKNAMIKADNNPDEVLRRLEDYEGVIHRVLLDLSMGKGEIMNPEFLLPFARAITKRFPQWGLVVAGGLGPDTMHIAHPILTEFPNASIDAQGKVPDDESRRAYIIEARKFAK